MCQELSSSRLCKPLTVVGIMFVLFLVFLPKNPLNGETGHWFDVFECANPGEATRKIKVYSILRAQMKDQNENLVWPIGRAVLRESEKNNFVPLLVLAIITVESRSKHDAVSARGARGLMQIRPFVA